MPPKRTCSQVARKHAVSAGRGEMSTHILMLHVLQQHQLSVGPLGKDLWLEWAAQLLDGHFLPRLLVYGWTAAGKEKNILMSAVCFNRSCNPTGPLLEKSWFLCSQDSTERFFESSEELCTQRCYPVRLWAAHHSLCSLRNELGHQEKHEWLIFIPFNLQKWAVTELREKWNTFKWLKVRISSNYLLLP